MSQLSMLSVVFFFTDLQSGNNSLDARVVNLEETVNKGKCSLCHAEFKILWKTVPLESAAEMKCGRGLG